MREGLNVLRMLFYANLLAGEHDTLEVLEIERDNDQKMDIELINRRQRHNEEQDEQTENPLETTTASTISPGRNRSTSFSMRTSTSEQDEVELTYENPLQVKLNLEPNEYRHGHLPFNDFINEFANEKIEISKEYLEFVRERTSNFFSFNLYPFFLSTINKIGNCKISLYFIIY